MEPWAPTGKETTANTRQLAWGALVPGPHGLLQNREATVAVGSRETVLAVFSKGPDLLAGDRLDGYPDIRGFGVRGQRNPSEILPTGVAVWHSKDGRSIAVAPKVKPPVRGTYQPGYGPKGVV